MNLFFSQEELFNAILNIPPTRASTSEFSMIDYLKARSGAGKEDHFSHNNI